MVVGSLRLASRPASSLERDGQAFTWLLDHGGGLQKRSYVIQLPNDWGYFAITYHSGSGHDYFRFTSQEIVTQDKEETDE